MGYVILILIGIAVGVFLIRRSTRTAASSGSTRDIVRMPVDDSVLPKIEAWASRHGYRPAEEQDSLRTYKATTKLTATPVFLRVERIGDEYELQSWVIAAGLGGGGELAIGAPGIVLKLPRNQAKGAHNELRRELGLPSIP